MIPERRRITDDEIATIRVALNRALIRPINDAARTAVEMLEVVSRCDCGCASVDFEAPSHRERSTVMADGTGTTPRGGQVGIIVWGRSDAITGLEIYDLGAGNGDLVLPVPNSVVPWQQNNAS